MLEITKRFPGVLANDEVDFSARWGELHALIGENGAGKTTLMNVLYGLHPPGAGEIKVSGQPVEISTPRDAIALGIGMVHQQFMLVRAFTALENIILGREPVKLGRTDYRLAEEKVRGICDRFGLQVDLSAKVADLSVSSQQKVEILKALYRDARILILDEPTSVLAPREAESLFEMLRRLTGEGMCVILISHKLRDVMDHSDRVTVLRRGRSVACMETTSTSAETLARLMVGEDTEAEDRPSIRPSTDSGLLGIGRNLPEPACPGPGQLGIGRNRPGSDYPECPQGVTRGREKVLAVQDLSAAGDSGAPAVDALSFEVSAGEILGVAGVDGNGQRELAEALIGLRKSSGSIILDGREIHGDSVRRRLHAGIAYIPEDRRFAVVPEDSIRDNAILGMQHDEAFARHGVLNAASARECASTLIADFDVRAVGPEMPVEFLSGGNQQKLVLGRSLYRKPRLLIACQPTRGLDVNAAAEVHRHLVAECARGAGILLISYDLDEILALSDRILVMYHGRSAGILSREEATRESVGALMLGTQLPLP